MDILVNVVNQKMCVCSTREELVDGSQQFVKFRFNLSESWDGLMTFAQFTQNGKSYNQYLDDENSVYLPAEIGVGTFTLMLYGSHNATIGTTNYLTLKLNKNILVSDAQSTDISESLYNQLISKIKGVQAGDIEDGTITGEKIADLAIEDNHIEASAIQTRHLGYKVVKAINIAIDAVENEKILNGAVTGDKIANNAIQTKHLGYNIVQSFNIENGAVTPQRLAETYLPIKTFEAPQNFTDADYDTFTTPGIYRIDNNTGRHEVLTVVRPNSDSYIMQTLQRYDKTMFRGAWSSDGTTFPASDWEQWKEVGNTEIGEIPNGTITGEKIADLAIEDNHIEASAIQTRHLGYKVVKAINIAIDAVENEKILNGAVTSEKLTNKAVTPEKLSESYKPIYQIYEKLTDGNLDFNRFKTNMAIVGAKSTISGNILNSPGGSFWSFSDKIVLDVTEVAPGVSVMQTLTIYATDIQQTSMTVQSAKFRRFSDFGNSIWSNWEALT